MPSNVEWPDCGVEAKVVVDLLKKEWPDAPVRVVHNSLAVNGPKSQRNAWVDKINACINTLKRIEELEVKGNTDAPLKSLSENTDA